MYKSQFRKIDPYDWFCGPGSHLHIVTYLFSCTKLQLKCTKQVLIELH